MPRFYFPILDNDRVIIDPEGVVLPDLDKAISEARRTAFDMLNDAVATGESIGHQVIQIYDGDGQVLASVRFDEVIEDEGDE
jgi:hypothetical protein